MLTNFDDIRMPYELDVSEGAYAVLGAVGEAVAAEHGLANHYEGTESYYTGFRVGRVHVSGADKDELERRAEAVKEASKGLGVHPKFAYDMHLGYRSVYFDIVRTEEVESVERSPTWTDHVDRYTVDVEYGCLPERLAGNIDSLKDTESVRAAVERAGRADLVYELLDHLHGYADRSGRTAEVLGLADAELYAQLEARLDDEVAERTLKVRGSLLARIPIVGGWYASWREGGIEEMRERKQTQIDAMEAALAQRDE